MINSQQEPQKLVCTIPFHHKLPTRDSKIIPKIVKAKFLPRNKKHFSYLQYGNGRHARTVTQLCRTHQDAAEKAIDWLSSNGTRNSESDEKRLEGTKKDEEAY